jgi:hypothetical protein
VEKPTIPTLSRLPGEAKLLGSGRTQADIMPRLAFGGDVGDSNAGYVGGEEVRGTLTVECAAVTTTRSVLQASNCSGSRVDL